jgi:hypothetical protein
MKNIRHILLLFTAIVFAGCTSFVEVEVPDSQLTGAIVFEDVSTANAAMADLYSKLRDTGVLTGQPSGTGATLGLYADELDYYAFGGDGMEFLFANALLPSNPIVSDTWNVSYHQIYCCNAVIEGVAQSTALTEAQKQQFTGEALFVRSLVHFYLLNIYGDIPYITTTDYEVNRLAERMPASQIYENIVTDLTSAIELLPENYISDLRVRPNKYAAHALLARVYLYSGAWAEAANEASAVLNSSLYVWDTNLDNTFLKGSTGTIWQFAPNLPGSNANESALFIFLEGPPPFIALSNGLMNAFEPGDLREEHWTEPITDGTDTWYYAHKYKEIYNTENSIEFSVVFRLAEMYLIRAEARARQGELTGAKEDLNVVRNRAGLPDTDALAADGVVAAVLRERRVEFFTEYGHRFFDLKRTGSADAVLSLSKPGWNATDVLWPIPETELLANPNLNPQNPGY